MDTTKSDKDKYWNGTWNHFVRYYFYVQQGLALLNELRYLILAILAIYALLKLENFWLMPLMFLCSVPVLGIIGFINMHKMKKTMEFLNIQFATHFSRYSIELQEKQIEMLEEIIKCLKKS